MTDQSDELASLKTRREAIIADLATATAAENDKLVDEFQATLYELDVRIAAIATSEADN